MFNNYSRFQQVFLPSGTFSFYDEMESNYVNLNGAINLNEMKARFAQYLFRLLAQQIRQFNEKANTLDTLEKEPTIKIIINLNQAIEDYKKKTITPQMFKKRTNLLINAAHKRLDHHAGYTHILSNIALVIGSLLTLGIAYVATALYQRSFFPWFSPPEESYSNQLRQMNKITNRLAEEDLVTSDFNP